MNASSSNDELFWHNLGIIDGAKVLLVEDDPVTRWMVRMALKDECRFATATTANKAFAICQSFRPDIVFLDIGLPDKNGCEVLEWLMRNDPGVCVVVFSGSRDMNDICRALEGGAKGYIPKPFEKNSFLHYIKGGVNALKEENA